jgi:O-antigen/teichoic acid export membrane protein
MTDPRFHAAASLVALAALMRVGWGVYTMMGSGIELSSNTRPYSLISLAGLIVVVGASTLLIPRCGAGGAAVATSLAYFAMAYMARRLARTRIDIPYDWPRVAALGGAAAVCVAATYLAASLPTAPRLSVACALPAAYAVVAFRILRKGDSQAVGPLASWPVEAGS